MKPTEEQQAIIDAKVDPGDALKILAYAGTGKTSTLVSVAEVNPSDQILYLAFNKSVEQDAAMRFPVNTQPKTGHALAYKFVGRRYQGRIKNLANWELSKAYGLSVYESSLLLASYEHFLSSGDDAPDETCVQPDHLHKLHPTEYIPGMVQRVKLLFSDMQQSNRGLPMTHSCYLKMFQLQKSPLGFPIVMLDEAQDTNSVMHALVRTQVEHGSRLYLVGDSYQQIYSWRGAQDAMAKFEAPERRLSQSFRFGPAVADVASRLLFTFFGEQTPVKGLDSIPSIVGRVPTGEKLTILCRTNGGLIRAAYSACLNKRNYNVVGEQAYEESLKSMDNIYLLYSNKRGLITENRIARHATFSDLKTYADETLDAELMSKVLLIEDYGSDWPGVRESLSAGLAPDPEILLTTCHKAKGLEWDNVLINSDFKELFLPKLKKGPEGFTYTDLEPKEVVKYQTDSEEKIHSEEVNLFYVAATRAKRCLQLPLNVERGLKLNLETESSLVSEEQEA